MKIKVKFLANYRHLFQEREKQISLPEGARLKELLLLLCDSTERQEAVLNNDLELSPHVVIMKNGTPVQSPGGLAAPLADGDVIAVFPLLGGG